MKVPKVAIKAVEVSSLPYVVITPEPPEITTFAAMRIKKVAVSVSPRPSVAVTVRV